MNKNNLLLEIGTEEIPASFIPPALKYLESSIRGRLEKNFLSLDSIKVFGTPRRLAVSVNGLADRQPDREEIQVGPPAKVAFAKDGSPTRAAEGFAKKHGVDVADLSVKDTERGPYAVLRKIVSGRDTSELLKTILPEIITSIPFPKTMRWEASGLRFARPIRWIVALYGQDPVPFSMAGVESGRQSRGHRFMAPGQIELKNADCDAYLSTLRKAHVIPDPDERQKMVLDAAERAAGVEKGRILPDQRLLELNTYLTEFPSAVCGSFDRSFLELPKEVLITAMREHQKYFAVVDDKGNLLPNFIAVNNTLSPRVELVREGHERVIRARLSDAAFFFREDKKRPLEAFVPELSGVVFHEKLGSLLDKTKRVRTLAGHLAERLAPDQFDVVRRAAFLCKADLLTEMVGEFPTLQGTMGRVYALVSGESPETARAIEEHYLPVRSGGDLPATAAGAICSIADKIDTICGTFTIGFRPSGTADPYGLRRLSLGILSILESRSWSLSLTELTRQALGLIYDIRSEAEDGLVEEIIGFFQRRFVFDLIARGFRQDIIEAAIRAGFENPLDCLYRIKALSAVRKRGEFESLSLAFKRVMNILKDYEGGEVSPELMEADEEKRLYNAAVSLKQTMNSLLGAEKGESAGEAVDEAAYEKAFVQLLTIRPHVDNFFDNVLVMAEDERVRNNRRALLWQISRLFLRIGDLSAIVVNE